MFIYFWNAVNALDGYDVLLIHQTPEHSNPMIPFDVQPEEFGCRVFCGHIHRYEDMGNLVIIGSPLHRDLEDVGQDKGFLVYDLNADTYDRVLLDYPKFESPVLEIKQREPEDLEVQLNSSKDDILMDFTKAVGKEAYFKTGKKLIDGSI